MNDFYLKRVTKNQTITETEIKAKFDEMTSILEQSGEDHNEDNPTIALSLDPLILRTDRLVKLLPTFKRIADNFEEMSEKQSNNKNNCFHRKPIDIIDENINCLVKTGHQIQRFQQSDNYFKSLTKK